MLNLLKAIDRVIPLWELIVIGMALLGIAVVLVLWWAYGYNLVVAPEPVLAQPVVTLAASLL